MAKRYRKSPRAMRCEKAIREWYAKYSGSQSKIKSVGHIHPVCHVAGQTAERCLIVSMPWVDAEPQLMARENIFPLNNIHTFDSSLKAGDWCTCAYVLTASVGELVAIKVVRY